MRTCSIEGCSNEYLCKGMCNKHYSRTIYKRLREKMLERSKNWRNNNKEKIQEYYQNNRDKKLKTRRARYARTRDETLRKRKEYEQKNKEKLKEYRKEYYIQNRNNRLKYAKDYRENNRYLHNSRAAKYRAVKLQQTPPWANLVEIREFYKNCPKDHHVDHIIPLKGKQVRGLHVIENLQYLPAIENMRKGNKLEAA